MEFACLKLEKTDNFIRNHQFTTFFRLTNSNFASDSELSYRAALWNTQAFSNRQRTFLFKFFNNFLGLNTRISHFVENTSRSCTFCVLSGRVRPPDETFFHLFLSCPTTVAWYDSFISELTTDLALIGEFDQINLWFYGRLPTPTTTTNL